LQSTPQLKQGCRFLDDGQSNCSLEKEHGDLEGESKSVETTCNNSVAETTCDNSVEVVSVMVDSSLTSKEVAVKEENSVERSRSGNGLSCHSQKVEKKAESKGDNPQIEAPHPNSYGKKTNRKIKDACGCMGRSMMPPSRGLAPTSLRYAKEGNPSELAVIDIFKSPEKSCLGMRSRGLNKIFRSASLLSNTVGFTLFQYLHSKGLPLLKGNELSAFVGMPRRSGSLLLALVWQIDYIFSVYIRNVEFPLYEGGVWALYDRHMGMCDRARVVVSRDKTNDVGAVKQPCRTKNENELVASQSLEGLEVYSLDVTYLITILLGHLNQTVGKITCKLFISLDKLLSSGAVEGWSGEKERWVCGWGERGLGFGGERERGGIGEDDDRRNQPT
ncbi:hypothetical protein IFM89_019393, partial [Coptis chinensis]